MNEGLIIRKNVMEDEVAMISRPLAEYLSLDYSAAILKKYVTRRKPAGLFHCAWRGAEMGLNQSEGIDDNMRRYYFDDAQEMLGEVIRSRESTEDARLEALTLSSYIPCFQKRAYREEITRDDCLDVYASLGAAMTYMQPMNPDDPPQWRMTETAILAASARIGRPDLLLYPTSPREEASRVSAENHDSYFVVNNQKLSIQQKLFPTTKQYQPHITLLNLQPMMEFAYRKNQLSVPEDVGEQVNYLLGLVVAETTGRELQRHEKGFLDHICRAIAYHHGQALRQTAAALN